MWYGVWVAYGVCSLGCLSGGADIPGSRAATRALEWGCQRSMLYSGVYRTDFDWVAWYEYRSSNSIIDFQFQGKIRIRGGNGLFRMRLRYLGMRARDALQSHDSSRNLRVIRQTDDAVSPHTVTPAVMRVAVQLHSLPIYRPMLTGKRRLFGVRREHT